MGAQPPESSRFASITVPSRVESVRLASEFLVTAARDMHVPFASDPLFELAIVEALNNAVKHGNAQVREAAAVICELERVDRRLVVRVLDQGPGYDLSRVPRQEWASDDIMSVPESGYGISIIKSVFPMVRTIARPGVFGLEMSLTF
jgi:anti-sigma regulatory factor (Ser/Thr protein kinase)